MDDQMFHCFFLTGYLKINHLFLDDTYEDHHVNTGPSFLIFLLKWTEMP